MHVPLDWVLLRKTPAPSDATQHMLAFYQGAAAEQIWLVTSVSCGNAAVTNAIQWQASTVCILLGESCVHAPTLYKC